MAIHIDWFREAIENPLRDLGGVLSIRNAAEEHGKFIATQSRNC